MTGLPITHLRLARLLKSLLWWARWFAALAVVIYLCNYLIDAHTRTTRAPGCRWNIVPNPNNVPYDTAYSPRFCYLARNVFLVQVHHADGTLVAERTYSYPDIPNFYWEPNGLGFIYDDGGRGTGGFIDLPPTLHDRLLAKLP